MHTKHSIFYYSSKGPPLGSKLQAHRGAALYAVEELHKLGELNDRFFPSPVSDSDDEEIQQEKINPQAGTEKRQWHCRNTVSQGEKDTLITLMNLVFCIRNYLVTFTVHAL